VVLLETPAFKGEFERAVAEKLNGNLVLDVHLIAWFVCTSKHTMFGNEESGGLFIEK